MDVFIGRKDDIGLLIKQDNSRHTIVIDKVQGSPEALMETLGYTPDEIESQSLMGFLPERITELVADYVEFDVMGNDLLNVIKRTPHFSMLSKQGDVVEMDIRVQYGVMGTNPRFILLASSKAKHVNACVSALEEYIPRNIDDPVFAISNRESFMERCAIIQQFVDDKGLKASYAVVQVEQYAELLRTEGEDAANAVMRKAVAQLQHTFRATDVLGSLGQGKLGVGLLKADADDVVIPFERLQKRVDDVLAEAGEQGSMTLRVAAIPALKSEPASVAIQSCEEIVKQLSSGEVRVIT